MTKRPKRPRDPNQLGKLIVDLSVGEVNEAEPAPDSPAVEFARQGDHVRFCERAVVTLLRATHRNIYVRSRRAGERVIASVSRFLTNKAVKFLSHLLIKVSWIDLGCRVGEAAPYIKIKL